MFNLFKRLEKQQLLTTNHEVNTLYSARESSFRQNTAQTNIFRGLCPALGTEGLQCLKEHANLEGHVQMSSANCLRHVMCPHDTPRCPHDILSKYRDN